MDPSSTKPHFEPSVSDFLRDCEDYDLIAVQAEFSCDTETPLSAYAKLADQKPAFLFESVVGGEQVSRFSFVGFGPRKIISCGQEDSHIIEQGKEMVTLKTPQDPLALVEEEMSGLRYRSQLKDGRFSGGAVGFLSYEYANRVEPTVPLPDKDELGIPLIYFMITDLVLIFDHARQTLTLTANVPPGENPKQAYADACARISQTHQKLSQPSSLPPVPLSEVSDVFKPDGNFSKEEFEKLVEKVKKYVRAGDVIQTVLSQRFKIPFSGSSTDLYRAIRAINPSPYMFLLENEKFSIVGASPEVHVRLLGDDVLIRPIAGTRKRGSSKRKMMPLKRICSQMKKKKLNILCLLIWRGTTLVESARLEV